MASVPIVAVPDSVMAHDVSPGAVAFPAAVHAIAAAAVKDPSAVPVSFRSLAHVAVNAPFADVAVCSLTFHLKSVHELGVGIRDEDVQLPRSELLPAADGDVSEL